MEGNLMSMGPNYSYFWYSVAIIIPESEDPIKKEEKDKNKKLSYCWETVRRESMPRIAEMDVEMTT